MPLDDRFPHYPGRALGYLYGCGSSTVLLWADDHTVEQYAEGSAGPEDLAAFEQLLDGIRQARPPNMAVAHDAILAAGWEYRGTLEYRLQSGLHLVDAAALAEISDELWSERETILAQSNGRHPEMGSEAWPSWITVTARRNAAVRGARAMALAAVEALVNELLAAQHPDEYADWETKKRMGFRQKLLNLVRLHGVDPDSLPWFTELEKHSGLRNRMLHHQPEWIVDGSDEESVAPTEDMTQELLAETLAVAHRAVDGLFALYGVPTPETHRPGWLRRAAEL
jgi:hypothetical protein